VIRSAGKSLSRVGPLNYDELMSRLSALFASTLVLAALLGCAKKPPAAKREIEVPDGGPPVLTSAERTAHELQPPASRAVASQPGVVTQAAFEQPAESHSHAIKPFERWTDQDAAEDALGRIGAPAVPALTDALRSTDPSVRRKAVEVLGRMGDEAIDAVPSLTALLDDPDPSVRKAAARTLGQIGPQAKDAVPALMRTLFRQPPAQTLPAGSPQLEPVPSTPANTPIEAAPASTP
jgi:hypothetical protein